MDQPLEPRLRIGALCERVLEEKDGVLSLIRIIDRFVITVEGVDVPRELPPGRIALTVVMSWVGGLGSYKAKVRVVLPGDESIESVTMPFRLASLDAVQNLIIQMVIPTKRQGMYWFEFLLDDAVQSRVPVRVIYERREHPKRKSTT